MCAAQSCVNLVFSMQPLSAPSGFCLGLLATFCFGYLVLDWLVGGPDFTFTDTNSDPVLP